MMYDIISTGSKGNAVVINDRIMIDCGVPYKLLEPYTKRLKLVLLTHEHGDHFVASSVRRLHKERPMLRFGCCPWMVGHLLDAGVDKRVIDVYEPEHWYSYPGDLQICPEPLFHNVPNCGYHIMDVWERLFYATDTGTLDGIVAKDYDLYMVEANHTKADIAARAAEKQARGEREAAKAQEAAAVAKVEAFAPPVEQEQPAEHPAEEPRAWRCSFVVTAFTTKSEFKSQLKKLKEFMNMEGIKYE